MSKHALLSASGAHRWMVCNPSPRLEESIPEVESTYADEGTLAHKISEYRIKEVVYGIDLQNHIFTLQQHPLYSEEMMGFIDEYAEFVADRLRKAPTGALLLQEHRVNVNEFVPEGFGTVDVSIPAPGVLEIIDYKHGKGVPVYADENEQLMVYAIGILLDFEILFDIEKVLLTIYQPRISNISKYELTRDDLMIWAKQVLAPTAKKAFAGLGELVPGAHCRFCRVAPVCEANAKMNLELAAKEFDLTGIISDEQISKILKRADMMKKWIKSVEAFALRKAMEGHRWPGMKIVQGRSVRKYPADVDPLIQTLVKEGYEVDKLLTKKLLAMTNLKKIVSTLHFKELVEPQLIKPPGKPALVGAEDARPEWNSADMAALEFDDESEENE